MPKRALVLQRPGLVHQVVFHPLLVTKFPLTLSAQRAGLNTGQHQDPGQQHHIYLPKVKVRSLKQLGIPPSARFLADW